MMTIVKTFLSKAGKKEKGQRRTAKDNKTTNASPKHKISSTNARYPDESDDATTTPSSAFSGKKRRRSTNKSKPRRNTAEKQSQNAKTTRSTASVASPPKRSSRRNTAEKQSQSDVDKNIEKNNKKSWQNKRQTEPANKRKDRETPGLSSNASVSSTRTLRSQKGRHTRKTTKLSSTPPPPSAKKNHPEKSMTAERKSTSRDQEISTRTKGKKKNKTRIEIELSSPPSASTVISTSDILGAAAAPTPSKKRKREKKKPSIKGKGKNQDCSHPMLPFRLWAHVEAQGYPDPHKRAVEVVSKSIQVLL